MNEYKEYPEGEALKRSFEDRLNRQLCLFECNNVAEMGRLAGYRGDIEIGSDKETKMPMFISYATSNIPYIPYTPAKRVSVLGHSLRTAGIWINEEKPLIPIGKEHFEDGAINHKVSTLNAKICYAETKEDNMLTEDDSLIISPAFAKKASYIIVHRLLEDYNKPLLVRSEADALELNKEITVTKGQHLLTKYKDSTSLIDKFLYTESTIPYSGVLIPREILSRKKKIVIDSDGEDKIVEEVFMQRYNIVQKGEIGIGDKLLLLGGCKGIVSAIKELPDKADIMLSKLSVWNKDKPTSQRGGLLKEIDASKGYAMVFYQPEHLRINVRAGRSTKPTMSSTMYPFLMQSDYMRENIDLNNKRLFEMLKMADIKVEKMADGSLYLVEIHTDGEETLNDVYLPDFLSLWYVKQKKHLEYVITRTPIFNAILEEKRTLLDRLIQTNIRAYLRPSTKGIKGLIAIPHNRDNNIIVLNPKDAKRIGKNVLVYREPVCEVTSIQSMVVVADEETPVGVARVHPFSMRAMNGDFDGDLVYVLDYEDPYFKVTKEKYETYKNKESTVKIVLPKVDNKEVHKKTIEEIIADAKEWHNKGIDRAVFTSNFGGKIKKATLKAETPEDFDKTILPYAGALEGSLKDSKVKGKGGEKVTLRERYNEVYLKAEIDNQPDTAIDALFVKGKVEPAIKGKKRSKSKWIAGDFLGKKLSDKTGIFYLWFKAD